MRGREVERCQVPQRGVGLSFGISNALACIEITRLFHNSMTKTFGSVT
jgi:hypothetical protein